MASYSAGWAPLCPPIVPVHYCCGHIHTHHDTPEDRRHTEKSVHLLLQTIRALRRGVPCLVRKVNCAFNRTERRKTLMATSAREDVAGGSTANCGSVFDDIETHRIRSTCVTRIDKRKATAADGAGAGPSHRPSAAGAGAGPSERQKDKSGGSKKGGSRARPNNNTKLEILKLLDAKVSRVEIADRFGCSERFIRTVKADRKKVEAATAAGGGTQKTARRGDFSEVSFLFPAFFSKIVSILVRCLLACFFRPCFSFFSSFIFFFTA